MYLLNNQFSEEGEKYTERSFKDKERCIREFVFNYIAHRSKFIAQIQKNCVLYLIITLQRNYLSRCHSSSVSQELVIRLRIQLENLDSTNLLKTIEGII